MDCIKASKEYFGKLASLVGISRAKEIIEQYGEKPPLHVVSDARADFLDSVYDGTYLKEDIYREPTIHYSNAEEVEAISKSPAVNRIISKLNNQIKLLERDLIQKKENKQAIRSRIFDLKEDIIKLKKTKKLNNALDIVTNNTEQWIRNTIIESNSTDPSLIRKAYLELDMYDSIVNTLLEHKVNNKTGELEYKITNKAIVSRANNVMNRISETRRMLDTLMEKSVLDIVNSGLTKKASLEELKNYVDISEMTSMFRDAGATDNKVATYIHKVTQAMNQNMRAEAYETVDRPLEELQKKTGIYLANLENSKMFLMRDEKGEHIPYLINEFNKSYYDFLLDLKGDANSLHRLAQATTFTSKKVKALNKDIRKRIKKNLELVDTEKLLSKNPEEVQAEINRLEKIYGGDRASDLVDKALKGYNDYLDTLESYIEMQNRKAGILGKDINDTEIKATIARFDKLRNPLNVLKAIKEDTSSILITKDALSNLAFAPKISNKEIENKFKDKDFELLKKDPKKLEMYNFIKNSINNSLRELPEHVKATLDESFLPTEFRENLFDAIKGKGVYQGLKDSFFEGFSLLDRESSNSKILDASNRPIQSVPIQFVTDHIRRIEEQIKNNSNLLEDLPIMIERKIKTIKELEEGIRTNKIDERYIKLLEKHKTELESYKRQFNEIDKLLPKLEEKRNLMMKTKNIYLGDVIKTFNKMALNYKYRIKVQDQLELTRKYMIEKAESVAGKAGKPLLNAVKEHIISDKDSQLVKLINSHIDSTLYDKFSENAGFSEWRVGRDKEARERVREFKKASTRLKEDFINKRITEKEYIESLDNLKEKINKEENVGFVTLSKAADMLNSMVYRVNMGWNPSSSIMNIVYGRIANETEAAAERFFTREELKKARKLMRSSLSKSLTGKDNETARKIRNAIMKYGTITDLLEDSYGSNRGLTDRQKKLGLLNAMEGQRRGEYLNQGEVLLAMMLHTKLKTEEGKEINLWEAMDKDANLKSNIAEKEKWALYTEEGINEMNKFRTSVNRIVMRLHGNYDIHSPIRAKRTVIGKFLMTFKSYLPEAVATRFEKERYDEELDYTVKGRWRTYASLGLKESLSTLYKIGLSRYFKKELNLENKNLSEIDIDNMKRNFVEVQYGLAFAAIQVLASMLFSNDDKKTFALRHTFDLLSRAQQDITLYFNPYEMYKMVNNPFPQLNYIKQLLKEPIVLGNYITDDNPRHDTEYLIRNTSKLTPFAKQLYRVGWGDLNYKGF